MAEAFRRLLWSAPVFSAFAALLFFLLAQLQPVAAGLSLPLFINPHPDSAANAALSSLDGVIAGDEAAKKRLARLGGAALPSLLPRLSSLSVSQRRKVVLALRPVAARMGLSAESIWSPGGGLDASETQQLDQDLLMWERYKDIHGIDLRPLSVARLVKRVVQREGQLRALDLRAADTYALPALVAALGRIQDADDVMRARRITEHIAHATDMPWRIAADASVQEALEVVTQVRRYFDAEGAQWTQLSQFEYVVAHVSQTEFAVWVARTVREVSGIDHSRVFEQMLGEAQISFPLLMWALAGMLLVGPALAATIQVSQLGDRRWRIERFGLRLALAGAVMASLAWLVRKDPMAVEHMGFLSLLLNAALSAFILHREMNDRLDWRTHHVLRRRGPAARILAAAGWLAPSIPTLLPLALTESFLWLTCLEASTGAPGLGASALEAVRLGDLPFLMALGLALVAATGSAQLLSDLALGNAEWKRTDL